MATLFSNALQPSNSTDALFRAWGQFIHDLFTTTAAWVNTADTGQIDFVTVLKPASPDTKMGYKIYRMDDALQATAPIFIRVDFGSGVSSANQPAIWLTIGTGSNGTGTITGILFNGGATSATVASSGNSATASNSYGSGAGGSYITCGLFAQPGTARNLVFTIERTKDAAGADTGVGLLLFYNNATSNINVQRFIIQAGGSQPPIEDGLQIILSSNNPSTFSGDVGIGIPIPIRGYAQQPGLGMACVKLADFVAEATFVTSLYGVNHTYQHLNSMTGNVPGGGGTAWSNMRVAIRYE